MRTNVYVDGFNLYYGCLKGTPYKWLDLDALARQVLPRDEIHRIRYFTARIAPRPDNRDAPNRQDFYLRALALTPGLSIHLGRFQRKNARMRLAHPPANGSAMVEVIKIEEKGSDVNLATYLVADARPTFFKQIRTSALRRSQLPDKLKDEQGEIRRPKEW